MQVRSVLQPVAQACRLCQVPGTAPLLELGCRLRCEPGCTKIRIGRGWPSGAATTNHDRNQAQPPSSI